jgi:acyl-CoA synthetase (NDP forming)
MASIHKMLNPRSIAVVGATPRMQYGGRFLAASLKAKDRVRVYPVNPRYPEVLGARCYPTISDLPEAPDLVGIVVPYDQVMETLQESHRKTGSTNVVKHLTAYRVCHGLVQQVTKTQLQITNLHWLLN